MLNHFLRDAVGFVDDARAGGTSPGSSASTSPAHNEDPVESIFPTLPPASILGSLVPGAGAFIRRTVIEWKEARSMMNADRLAALAAARDLDLVTPQSIAPGTVAGRAPRSTPDGLTPWMEASAPGGRR